MAHKAYLIESLSVLSALHAWEQQLNNANKALAAGTHSCLLHMNQHWDWQIHEQLTGAAEADDKLMQKLNPDKMLTLGNLKMTNYVVV